MNHRLLAMLLLGTMVWMTQASLGLALGMHVPGKVKDVKEATAFFSKLMRTSRNPVIISMARESLDKLTIGDAQLTADNNVKTVSTVDKAVDLKEQPAVYPGTIPGQSEARHVVEIALLPQTDDTYAVPALVNKKFMATFLVDTGASYTVITPQMAEALGLEINKDTPRVSVTTANGTMEAPVVYLKQVSLGGLKVYDVEAVVTDLGNSPQLSGLLGMSFFKGMEIAFKRDRLVITH